MGAGDYDVAKADELGFSIKLLGISSQTDSGSVLQRVHLAMIPKTTALGSTHGVINGLFTMGDFVGPTFSQGPGAGRDPTASACVVRPTPMFSLLSAVGEGIA